MPRGWTWARDPKKVKLPVLDKVNILFEIDELIEDELRNKYVKPAPRSKNTNYIVDLYSLRNRQYFYFCAKYHCRAKNRIEDYFEHRFARLEYTYLGFNLAYMRHTGKWWQVAEGLSLQESFKQINEDSLFAP